LIEGADVQRSGTILATTRNLSGANLNGAKWLGADTDASNEASMAGLMYGQGQLTLTDGSARQSNNADLLNSSGSLLGAHIASTGGVTIGNASTALLGCSAGGLMVKTVRFQQVRNDHFNFGEIEIMSGGVNVGRLPGHVATASAQGWGGTAEKALDGKNKGGYDVHSTQKGAAVFWQVELAAPVVIDQIIIYNRSACCQHRLNPSKMIGKDADGKELWVIDVKEQGNVITLTVPTK